VDKLQDVPYIGRIKKKAGRPTRDILNKITKEAHVIEEGIKKFCPGRLYAKLGRKAAGWPSLHTHRE
jgi:hypothetical protein